jgi:hypothetical protein
MRRLEPLRRADLPDRRLPFWKLTGPGAVLVGLSIGAGELVMWPWITARFGAGMAWAAVLGVFLQLWINLEIGRWAIATGESPFSAMARLWRGFVLVFLALNVLFIFLPAWARTSGAALKALLFGPDGPGPDWVWTAITFAGIAAVLFGPKAIYTGVERAISVMVVVITLGLIFVVAQVATLDTIREMLRGMISFGHLELDDQFPFHRFFSAVVFAGAGGLGNLFYAYYLRDKGIGMGARIPRLVNPLRGREEAAPEVGYTWEEGGDVPENRRRFRDWMRFVTLDQVLYFWLLNTFTLVLFMLGALAVLHPQGLVPAEGRLVWDLAAMLEVSMGTAGRTLFLLIGMAALWSTQLTYVDGGARVFADLLGTHFGRGAGARRRWSQGRLYLVFAAVIMVFGVASTWLLERFEITALGFIFNSALIGGFAMAIYCPALLWANLRLLPRDARPGPVHVAMAGIASAVYVAFAAYTVIQVFT